MRRFAVQTPLLAVVLGCSLTSCGQTRSPETAAVPTQVVRASHTGQPAAKRPERSQTTQRPEPPHRCQADQLQVTVVLSGAVMSQPFDDISITNSGARACVLSGYPRIAVAGHRGLSNQPAPAVPVAISVRHGIYERVDPGPHPVRVPPRHHVFFSVGTGDAYDGPTFTLTRLTVILPGTRSPHVLAVGLPANGPPGRRIPVGITAISRSPHA